MIKRKLLLFLVMSFVTTVVFAATDLNNYLPGPGYYKFKTPDTVTQVWVVSRTTTGATAKTCVDDWEACFSVTEKGLESEGDVWIPAPLKVGKSWQDADGIKSTVLYTDKTVTAGNTVYKKCFVIEIEYPKGILGDSIVVEQEYWCPGVGNIRKDVKVDGKFVVDMTLFEFTPASESRIVSEAQLLGTWDIKKTSLTQGPLPNPESYTFKTDNKVLYTVSGSPREYSYKLLANEVIIYREFGQVLIRRIAQYANGKMQLVDQEFGIEFDLEKRD
jgi:hypothetical protein